MMQQQFLKEEITHSVQYIWWLMIRLLNGLQQRKKRSILELLTLALTMYCPPSASLFINHHFLISNCIMCLVVSVAKHLFYACQWGSNSCMRQHCWSSNVMQGNLRPYSAALFLLLDHFFNDAFSFSLQLFQLSKLCLKPLKWNRDVQATYGLNKVQKHAMQSWSAKILMECQKMASKIAWCSRVFLKVLLIIEPLTG